MTRPISELSGIAPQYDALLLDLWGVIHDGDHLYPGVHDALVKLKQAGKKIIFISNAPRRAAKVEKVLNNLGVEPALYDTVVSSGEVGYQWLKSGKAPFGKRYYYIGPEKDLDILQGLDYQQVDTLDKADFLLNVGFGSEYQSVDNSMAELKEAKQRNLPMLCLNPDLEVVKMNGDRFPCAGAIAKEYDELGGKVQWFGKPHNDVYAYCMEKLANVPKNRILAVGDSLETDIPGARDFGIDSVLVTGGILHHETPERIGALCKERNLCPTYVMPGFTWKAISGPARSAG